MVTPFRAPDKLLGVQAADAVRERLADDNPQRILFIIPRDDINKTLEQSGFPINEPLPPTEAKSLATFVRADEYLDGVVSKTATGFRLEARLFLGRDNSYSQPLPAIDGVRLAEVAAKLSRTLDDVRRQIEDEKKCYTNTRLRQEKEAIKNAEEAIRRYPRAVLARVCLLQAMDQSKANKDSMFRVAQEILAIDSISRPGLTLVSSYYKERGDSTRYVVTLTKLFANDPTNPRLADRVVTDLVLYKRMKDAIPIIKRALEENPYETQLMATAFKLYHAASEWKEMASVGEELVRIDTAFADSAYYYRMAQGYSADSLPAKVAETFARAVRRFPGSTSWLLLLAQVQRQQGQDQQAIETFRKAIAIDPKTPGIYVQLARIYADAENSDSALAMLRHGADIKDSVPMLAQYALVAGNNLYKKATANKDSTATQEKVKTYVNGLRFLTLSDSLAPAPTAKFLIGVSAFQIGLTSAQDASKTKSCDLAKSAADYFGIAQLNVAQGGATNPQAAGQIMGALGQYMPIIDNQKKQFCK